MEPTRVRLNELLRELGAAEVQDGFVDSVHTAPDVIAVLTVPGFEFHRDDLPATTHRALSTGLPVTPEAVAAAVLSVLADAEIKVNVMRLAKVYAEHDPITAIEALTLN